MSFSEAISQTRKERLKQRGSGRAGIGAPEYTCPKAGVEGLKRYQGDHPPQMPSACSPEIWAGLNPALSLPTGPSQWHKLYPIAQGDRQSPINIVSSKVLFSPRLKPLKFSYEGCTSISIANNGHSVQVDFNDSDDRSGKWPLTDPGSPPPGVLTPFWASLGRAACCGGEGSLHLSPALKPWAEPQAP